MKYRSMMGRLIAEPPSVEEKWGAPEGAYWWTEEEHKGLLQLSLWARVPYDKGSNSLLEPTVIGLHRLFVRLQGTEVALLPNWTWDGNPVRPTLYESIECGKDGALWRGHLRAGFWSAVDGPPGPE